MQQATRDGVNSITVCQPSVMMLVLPFQAELISTIGPGSRKWRTSETGKSLLRNARMIALPSASLARA